MTIYRRAERPTDALSARGTFAAAERISSLLMRVVAPLRSRAGGLDPTLTSSRRLDVAFTYQ
jgi:hypothetical protein